MRLIQQVSGVNPRFTSQLPQKQEKPFLEGFKGFSSERDPVLPEPTLWQRMQKWILIAGLAAAASLGIWKFGEWQRDPVFIEGRYYNPRHVNTPDLLVFRVYTLPQSKRQIRVDLTLFPQPVPPDRPSLLQAMPPDTFAEGMRSIVRYAHYRQILPKMEAVMARAEATYGPGFTTDQLQSMLREPWTDEQGKIHPSLWRKPLANVTVDGEPFTLSLENIQVSPYFGQPESLKP